MFSRNFNIGGMGNDITNIKDFPRYCNSIENFIQFTKNVVVEPEQVNYEPLKKLLEKQKLKVILPLKNFCMRFIEQCKVFTQLHAIFIEYVCKLDCPQMGLSVISSQAIPFKLKKDIQLSFYYDSFLIYFNLEMYEKSFKKLQEIINKFANNDYQKVQSMDTNIFYCATYLFMCRLLNYKNFKKDIFYAVIQGDILNYHRGVDQRQMNRRQLIENLVNFGSGKQYNKVLIQNFIRANNEFIFVTIYNQCQEKNIKMRQYVVNQIADRQERIRISDIKQNQLNKPQNMQQINKFKNLAKYDCKESILYLNHEKGTQTQINEIISKCYDLNEAIKKLGQNDGSFKYKLRQSSFSLGGFSSKLGGLGMARGMLDDDDE